MRTSALTLNDGTTLQASGSGTISSHPISSPGSATIDTNGNSLSISSGISGTFLTKIGAGTLILGGTNTYGGSMTISAGTLQTAIPNTLSPTPPHLINGGTLDLNGQAQTILNLIFDSGSLTQGGALLTLSSDSTTLSHPLTIQGSNTISGPIAFTGTPFTGGTDIVYDTTTNTGPVVISGTLDFGGQSRTFNIPSGSNAVDMQVSDAISNGGTLTKIGTGVLQLSGTSSYTGGVAINNGTLAVTADANLGADFTTLTLSPSTILQAIGTTLISTHPISMLGSGANFDSNGNSFTISSAISGFTSALSKLGAGTLTLTGTNNYGDITNVQAGTLAISSDDNIGVFTNANVFLFDGTTLQANGSSNISAHPLRLFGSVTLDT